MGRGGAVALAIGVLIFAGILWHLDFFRNWHLLLQTNPGWLLLSLALLALHQFCSYSKWKLMYRSTGSHENQPLLPVYASVLVSGMITPARSGDVIASLSWRGIQGKVLACSIFNRISEGLLTIAISLCVLGFFFQSYGERVRWSFMAFVVTAIAGLIIFVFNRACGLFAFRIARTILQKGAGHAFIRKLLTYEEKIEAQIGFFYETMEQFRSRHVLTGLIAFTFLNRAITILVNMTLLYALGVFLPWTQVLGILAATWVSVFLSPVPGGFGIGDVAPSMILSNLGYPSQAANFIFINRVLDFALIFFWAVVWNRCMPQKQGKP